VRRGRSRGRHLWYDVFGGGVVAYSTRIVDRGRGPEIEGTRITVYDILDYHTKGHHHSFIASVLSLSSEQVLAGIKYIDEHEAEVMPAYREMREFAARGNPPHILALLEQSRQKVVAKRRELEQQAAERAAAAAATAGGAADARAAG
jgi:uncharacterized protein (DUF433 family)